MDKMTSALPAENDPAEEPRLTILVVEDEETDRLRLVKLCRRAGLTAEYHGAADLSQMQRQLDARQFDLIFIDYHLGLATGQEALELVKIHEDQTNAICIMVTSVDQPDVIIHAMRSGCADYLIKEELSVEAIRKSVTSAYERIQTQAELHTERNRQVVLEDAVSRFKRSFEPQLRRLMSAMLWRVRNINKMREPEKIKAQNRDLEVLCLDMVKLLENSSALFSERNSETTSRRLTLVKDIS